MNTNNQNSISASSEEHRGDPCSRPNTLKHRIKRAMAMDCDEPSEVHISSVLAAASALASLGNCTNTPPSTPENLSKASDKQLTITQMVQVDNSQALPHEFDHDDPISQALPHEFDHDVPMTFPQKLMEILSNTQLSDIVTWLPNGKGFIILQKRKFATEVMPMYFKLSKFTSFTRKLNRWGFTRVTRGPESGAYYHKYFQRGEHNLCMQMHCQSKMPPKENTSPKQSPSLSPIASPGVSCAMSSMQLEESFSSDATSGPFTNCPTSFSTSNPNIFAPDLTRRDGKEDSSGMKIGTQTPDSLSSSSGSKRPFGMQNEQALMMLKSHQQVIRQHITNSQHGFGHNTFQLSKLDPSFQQSRSFGHERAIGGTSIASATNRPFTIQAAVNALRRPRDQPQMSDRTAMTTLRHQDNITQPPTNDQAYPNMLRSNCQDRPSSSLLSALSAALVNPVDTQKIITQAMQAQMRDYNERCRRAKEAKSAARASESKPGAVKSNCSMSQSQVAQFRQDLAQNSSNDQLKSPTNRHHKSVRRASAA